jgi:hypothetical protein
MQDLGVLTTVVMKSSAFCDISLFLLRFLFGPEDGEDMFRRNVGIHIPDDTVSLGDAPVTCIRDV